MNKYIVERFDSSGVKLLAQHEVWATESHQARSKARELYGVGYCYGVAGVAK